MRGQKGNLVRSPVWLLRRDAEQVLTELGRQLGLTPLARLRAGIVHERAALNPPKVDGQVTDFAAERRRRCSR